MLFYFHYFNMFFNFFLNYILIPKGAACQNSTSWIIATLECHISFIQTSFLTKFVGLDFSSNLIFVVKFLANPRCYEDLPCILVQRNLVLDCSCSVKYGAFFTIAKLFFVIKNLF